MDWQKIVVHHSASPTSVKRNGRDIPVDAALIKEWHLNKGWSDIGYHLIILPDGSCQSGRPLFRPGAHCAAGNRNFTAIGVCMVGNFSEFEVPEVQLDGLIDRITFLMEAYGIKEDQVELHRGVPGAATECPGRYFPEDIFRQELHAVVN